MQIMKPAMRYFAFFILLFFSIAQRQSFDDKAKEFSAIIKAYSDIDFDISFDKEFKDWKIEFVNNRKSYVLYYAKGRYLFSEHLPYKDNYRRLLYNYRKKLMDPENFTPKQIEWISSFASIKNRTQGPKASTDFFDAIYNCISQESAERHIVPVSFLGKKLRVHERIASSLSQVENKLKYASKADESVLDFIKNLESAGGYSWRQITGTSRRSFHSMGIAIDLLPQDWHGKVIYWIWERNKGNSNWMFIPLSRRWSPPESVVKIFESEGFIWGGKWPIWDNMHFEYRPELLLARDSF